MSTMRHAASMLALLVAGAAVSMTWTSSARACASCGCGDPTLTTMGTELPFAGRLRVSLALRARTDRIGRAERDRTSVEEAALHAGVAWSILDWLTVALDVPLVARSLGYPNGGGDRFVALGDAETRARFVVWRDRPFAPSHVVSVDVGAKLPTGVVRDAPGSWAQPGTGSFDPLVGLGYTFLARPWLVHTAVVGYWPSEGHDGRQYGRNVRVSARVQQSLGASFALALGLEGRADEITREHGAREEHSGGAVLFAASEMSWSPGEDLLLSAQILVPVVDALLGAHDEGPAVWLGAVYDL